MTLHLPNQSIDCSTPAQSRPITRQEQAKLYELCKKSRRASLRLEAELLISRVKQGVDGDETGIFLGMAFLSAYRNLPFTLSLFHVVNLSAEDLRLFNQILFMHHVPGWDDEALHRVEQ